MKSSRFALLKVYDWAIFLPSVRQATLRFNLLTKERGLQMLSISDQSLRAYSHDVSMAQVLISYNAKGYAQLHAVAQHYPFSLIHHDLARLARISLWTEALLLTYRGAEESQFFLFYYHLLQWLNDPTLAPELLDTPFFYYSLVIHGVLPSHLAEAPSFAQLVDYDSQTRRAILHAWAENRPKRDAIRQAFLAMLPRAPKSLASLSRYD
ncbi:hypothetical protein [Entomospira culicis]|uniref:Uncharacterized protein n=1 Tax=Entomospira culicis TaxID=2719989 RepID=A0A968GFG2_9SPIO|nr:hypothetical protein [Entomospira culicis]NIZ19531.1 hypothetical protein [Entomospira culicis]NIZ69564.1 hypothetical protein [Entomospira culicis]WDI36675.1 hypothetical protein PVA46_04945 [Entomospira culicis]WDI38304.1 hypothetical protein PVA47_04955 [Entomospira culicis]